MKRTLADIIKPDDEEGEFNPMYPIRKYEKQEICNHKNVKLMAKCSCTKHWSENSSREDLQELINLLEKFKEKLDGLKTYAI